MLPRNAAFYLHAVKLLVKYDIVQVFIVLQNKRDVVQVILEHGRARLILQLFLPLDITITSREIIGRLRLSF
ncbi:hypothetical protein SDC9_185142 [bioreactor metagenome]|uniref:Uncharacterized protein n=1 Tax=bioreactor metagenome TaxID=1076179 RepID=A0A645HGV5_9ZZZZ